MTVKISGCASKVPQMEEEKKKTHARNEPVGSCSQRLKRLTMITNKLRGYMEHQTGDAEAR